MAHDLEQAEDAATKPISSTHLILNSRYSMKMTLGFVDADKLYPCTKCGVESLSRQFIFINKKRSSQCEQPFSITRTYLNYY